MSKNVAAGVIVAAIFVVGGLIAVRTFGTTGQDAIARMDSEEHAVLTKLQTIRRDMSFAQVVSIMGRPDDDGPLQMRPKWNLGGNPLNAVVVYIHSTGAHRFTWISIGRFVYDEELRT